MYRTGPMGSMIKRNFPHRDYGQEKLSLKDVLNIRQPEMVTPPVGADLQPGVKMIQNILCCNYSAALRLNSSYNHGDVDDDDDDADDDDGDDDEVGKQTSFTGQVPTHPLDMLLMAMYLSDPVLNQGILMKLAICQFAIPFLLPPNPFLPQNDPQAGKYQVTLWSTESLYVSYQISGTEIGKSTEKRITELTCHAVAFLRVGTPRRASKSLIASRLIRDDSHPCFLNRSYFDKMKKNLVKNYVDVAWYLPRGDPNVDRYNNPWMALNMHGPIPNLNDEDPQWLPVICEAGCNAICVFLGEDFSNEDQLKVLVKSIDSAIHRGSHHVDLVVWIGLGAHLQFLKTALVGYPELDGKSKKLNSSENDESKLVNRVINFLKKCINNTSRAKFTLTKLAECCKSSSNKVILDSDSPDVAAARVHVKNLVQQMGSVELQRKADHVPLQCLMPELIQLEKRTRRMYPSEATRDAEALKLYQKQNQLETECVEVISSKSESTFRTFLNGLQEAKSPAAVTVFLTHLQRELNARNSIILSDLRGKVMKLERRIQNPNEEDSRLIPELRQQRQECLHDMAERTVTVENFLRESNLLCHVQPNEPTVSSRHVDIAVSMLLRGFPIELMDGVSSHVPVNFIESVFTKLSVQIGTMSRICVVSVLGVQSSGKSTMLNVLFGLNFHVSVGRCTRGIFAQLLPLDANLQKQLKCSHVLLLDTEGLCSPELENSRQQDNELATFVVTVSDITLVNVKDENLTNLKDILQIVAFSMLRMRRAYAQSQIKFEPTCVLVHQNIDEVEAGDKLAEMQSVLQKQLDEAAQWAYRVEMGTMNDSGNISFRHIINFDTSDKDYVWFIPTLLKGTVPMATINPAYVSQLHSKKVCLLDLLQMDSSKFLTLNLFLTKMKDVCESILHENFAFSFKNMLEIRVYQHAERHFNEWELRIALSRAELENLAEIEIDNSPLKEADLQRIVDTFNRNLKAVYDKICSEDFVRVFDSVDGDEYHNLLQHMRQHYVGKLESLFLCQKCEGEKRISALFDNLEVARRFTDEASKYEKILWDHVKRELERQKHHSLTKDQVESAFNEIWKQWTRDISQQYKQELPPMLDVSRCFDECVKTQYSSSYNAVVDEYKNLLINSSKEEFNVHDPFPIVNSKGLKKFVEWLASPLKTVKALIQSTSAPEKVEKMQIVKNYTASRHSDIEKKLDELRRSNRKFDVRVAKEVIMVLTPMEGCESEIVHQMPKLTAQMLHHMRKLALPVFTAMQQRFTEKYNPMQRVEAKRDHYFRMFEGYMRKQELSQTITTTFVKYFKDFLITHFENKMAQIIAKYVHENCKCEFPHYKSELVALCLFSLGHAIQKDSKKGVKLLIKYTKEPKVVLKACLLGKMKSVFEVHSDQVMEHLRHAHLKPLVDHVRQAVNIASSGEKRDLTLRQWTEKMQSHIIHTPGRPELQNLGNEMAKLFSLREDEIVHVAVLKERCMKELDELQKSFTFTVTPEIISDATKFLADTELVNSCDATCPFCGSLCENSRDHENTQILHQVSQHRPSGINGWREHVTHIMAIENCTYDVASKGKFTLDGGETWHPYKDYQKIFPDWKIAADQSVHSSPYWMYIVANYHAEIAAAHGRMKSPEIPASWKIVTWEKAVESLGEYANNVQELKNAIPVELE